jgi:formylglycine-generating enzyme required for sulfatase activity
MVRYLTCTIAFYAAVIVLFDCSVLAGNRIWQTPGLEQTDSNMLSAPQNNAPVREAEQEFKDCPHGCPVMVTVPAGKFMMGSAEDEPYRNGSEGPLHEVKVAGFAVFKFEVAFEDWDVCVLAAACPRAPDSWGRGRMPVINVSWRAAKQYTAWLSKITGKDWRLLSESEWEYAARAGALTFYAWGNKFGTGDANCADCGSSWDGKQTALVGSFRPDEFGLHDMHGNVWEWVEDSWHDTYDGAPSDGSAWLQGGMPATALSAAVHGGTRASLSARPLASSVI